MTSELHIPYLVFAFKQREAFLHTMSISVFLGMANFHFMICIKFSYFL